MKIAFTSCMDATRVPIQPVWKEIAAQRPDVVLLLGDQIYMDWGDLGASNLKRLVAEKKSDGLDAFAHEMHARYEAQAAVPDFRALCTGSKVLAIWDDHDFAWNNAVGGGDPLSDRFVDEQIKTIAWMLFDAFRTFLRGGQAGFPSLESIGPGRPCDWKRPEAARRGISDLDALGPPVPLALLDTRWSRTVRGQDGNTVLHPDDLKELQDRLAGGQGLAILAGGSAMKHRHAFSEQDWHDPAGRSYAEYDLLLQAAKDAKRPVLYLSGDIHSNDWGGRLTMTNGTPSPVVQLLASPAGIDNVLLKRYEPSYGLLDIAEHGRAVNVKLMSLRKGSWVDNPAVGLLRNDGTDWLEPVGGSASAEDVHWNAARSSLNVLVCKRRAKRADWTSKTVPVDDALQEINDSWEPHPAFFAGKPVSLPLEFVRATVGSTAPGRFVLGLQSLRGESAAATAEAAIRQAFDKVRQSGGAQTSVVLYVHGAGVSTTEAIDQGCALGLLFPACEPVVFSWPAGDSESGLRRYVQGFDIKRDAPAVVEALLAVLRAFNAVAREYRDVVSVICGRSAGTALLSEVFPPGDGDVQERIGAVTRIVFSAAAVKGKALSRHPYDSPRMTPVFVTVNRNDQTLKWSLLFSGFGDAAGFSEVPDPVPAGVTYVDFTGVQRLGVMHDYLLTDLAPSQHAINDALLTRTATQLAEVLDACATRVGDRHHRMRQA